MSENTSFGLLKICDSDEMCLPSIRICSNSEKSSDMFILVGSFVMSLLFISFLSAICLYNIGNYNTMYKISKKVFCGFSIIHPTLLQDIVWDFQFREHIGVNQYNASLHILKESCKSDKHLLTKKDPLHGNTCLGIAIQYLPFDFLKEIIEKYNLDFSVLDGKGITKHGTESRRKSKTKRSNKQLNETMWKTGVNFIDILRTNFLYKHRFGSFFYVHVTREKLPKQRSS